MKKTVIYDFNNLAVRLFFSPDVYDKDVAIPDYNTWKFMMISNVLKSIEKFSPDEVVLAVDGKGSKNWRKIVFPRYKENRKDKRDKDDIDWETFYIEYELLCDDIINLLPFKVVEQSRCEGDDVIGVLSQYIEKPIIIISSDQDFKQLLSSKVKVYDQMKGEFMVLDESNQDYINRLCLKGQAKDNIFNVNMPDDYPKELRNPPMGDKTVDKIFNEGLDKFLDKSHSIKKEGYAVAVNRRENFNRNTKLVDLSNIPYTLVKYIKATYDASEKIVGDNNYQFFKKYNWVGILDDWGKTENLLMKLY